jgi:basic membrane protein A and related proteins
MMTLRHMKVLLSVVVLFALTVAGCGGAKSGGEKPAQPADSGKPQLKIAVVLTDKIGINPFLQLIDQGVKKGAKEFGIETKVIESKDWGAIEENLRAVAAEKKWDLILTNSFESADALTKVAAEFPQQKFAVADTVVSGPNVRSITFREHEAAYLLGAAAGLVTEKNVVGMVGPQDIPFIHRWSESIAAGLKATNPNAKFLLNWTGSFTDVAKAKELALQQFSGGADVILAVAAASNAGVFEAAKEKGFLTAGQDVDQSPLAPNQMVISQIKRVDVVVYETVKALATGEFKPGVFEYGIKENGVGLSHLVDKSLTRHKKLTDEVVKKLEAIQEKIVKGELKIEDPLQKK